MNTANSIGTGKGNRAGNHLYESNGSDVEIRKREGNDTEQAHITNYLGAIMIPKVGEAILIGAMKTTEHPEINPFGEGGIITVLRGGDRSYCHDIWVCIAVEDDRCAIKKLLKHGEQPGYLDFGSIDAQMILYNEYPIMKCTEKMLVAMTGYSYEDDLLKIVEQYKGKNV